MLKTDASQRTVGSFVSTYDAVLALLWKSITRAKMPFLNPNLDQKVGLVHALNTRTGLDPPLPDRYLGNAVALTRVEPLSISSILEDGNLPRIAAAVRAPIKEIMPDYVAGLPEWVAGLEDWRWIAIGTNSFLCMDLAGTSWQSMNTYTKHDFGFELPSALRWPNPAFEGYVFVYPSRTGVVGGDEGSEVCVCLEQTSADRLMSDEMLLRYLGMHNHGCNQESDLMGGQISEH